MGNVFAYGPLNLNDPQMTFYRLYKDRVFDQCEISDVLEVTKVWKTLYYKRCIYDSDCESECAWTMQAWIHTFSHIHGTSLRCLNQDFYEFACVDLSSSW